MYILTYFVPVQHPRVRFQSFSNEVFTVLCFCFVCLRLVYPLLPVSLDCPFLITSSVFSNVYLKTDRKARIQRAFLACFAESANGFYIFRQCTYIVFIIQCQKAQNNSKMNKVPEKPYVGQ